MVHKCNKIAYSAEFKWPVQLHRHKKCRHPERQKLILYTKDGNLFVCEKRKKKFSQQSNTARHVKTCKGVKEVVLLKCEKFPSEFKYKSLLKKHMITHERKDYQCSGCFRTFSRYNHFKNHISFHCSIINETVDSSVVDDNLSRTEDSFIPTFVDQNEPHSSTTNIHACNSIEDPSTLNPSLEFELSESFNEPTESIDTNTINKPTPVSYALAIGNRIEKVKKKKKILKILFNLLLPQSNNV